MTQKQTNFSFIHSLNRFLFHFTATSSIVESTEGNIIEKSTTSWDLIMPTVAISNADIQSTAVNNKSSVSVVDKLTSSSSSTTTTATATHAPRETLATINAKLVSAKATHTSTVSPAVETAPIITTSNESERMTSSTTAASSNLVKGSSVSSSENNNNSHSEGFLTPKTHHHTNINNTNSSRQRISAVKVTLPPGGVKGAAVKNSKINAPPGLNYVFDAHPNINKHHHHDYR